MTRENRGRQGRCWLCGANTAPGHELCRDDALASDPWSFHKASRAAQARALRDEIEPFNGQPWGQPEGEK